MTSPAPHLPSVPTTHTVPVPVLKDILGSATCERRIINATYSIVASSKTGRSDPPTTARVAERSMTRAARALQRVDSSQGSRIVVLPSEGCRRIAVVTSEFLPCACSEAARLLLACTWLLDQHSR